MRGWLQNFYYNEARGRSFLDSRILGFLNSYAAGSAGAMRRLEAAILPVRSMPNS